MEHIIELILGLLIDKAGDSIAVRIKKRRTKIIVVSVPSILLIIGFGLLGFSVYGDENLKGAVFCWVVSAIFLTCYFIWLYIVMKKGIK
jgi:hypothetical protein